MDKALEDVRMSRPCAVTDLWDLIEVVNKLENLVERLELVLLGFSNLYKEERIKNWELILKNLEKRIKREGENGEGISRAKVKTTYAK